MLLTFCCIYTTLWSMSRREGRASTPTAAEPDRFYNRIAVLRAERGLSRQRLADAVGVNYQTVGYLERGDYNPSLELAFRLSELFGVPIEAIFSRQPMRPMSEELYSRHTAAGGSDSAG